MELFINDTYELMSAKAAGAVIKSNSISSKIRYCLPPQAIHQQAYTES